MPQQESNALHNPHLVSSACTVYHRRGFLCSARVAPQGTRRRSVHPAKTRDQTNPRANPTLRPNCTLSQASRRPEETAVSFQAGHRDRFRPPAPSKASGHGAERDSLTLRQACSLEKPGSAMCVQNLDDSRGLAIRITYRISLRSSSLWEPRHPLLKVVV